MSETLNIATNPTEPAKPLIMSEGLCLEPIAPINRRRLPKPWVPTLRRLGRFAASLLIALPLVACIDTPASQDHSLKPGTSDARMDDGLHLVGDPDPTPPTTWECHYRQEATSRSFSYIPDPGNACEGADPGWEYTGKTQVSN